MATRKAAQHYRILFIGNSFTQRNNVPELLAELAAARLYRRCHYSEWLIGDLARYHVQLTHASDDRSTDMTLLA